MVITLVAEDIYADAMMDEWQLRVNADSDIQTTHGDHKQQIVITNSDIQTTSGDIQTTSGDNRQ